MGFYFKGILIQNNVNKLEFLFLIMTGSTVGNNTGGGGGGGNNNAGNAEAGTATSAASQAVLNRMESILSLEEAFVKVD